MTDEKRAPAVAVRRLTRRFGDSTVLSELDVDIAAGEFVALLGRSGSGKTTLLRAIAGLDDVAEAAIRAPSNRAVVFQEPRLLPWKHVRDNVVLGLKGPGLHERANIALAEVELGHRAEAWPATLSGGEAQRAALARALVREPELLLLDEPFASLDALTRIRMHELIQRLWQAHRPAILLVTHDVDEATLLADRALVLADGRIASTIRIDLPRPRDLAQPDFARLRAELLAELGVGEPQSRGRPVPRIQNGIDHA